MVYQVQDIKSVLYDGTALVADGNSTEIDFGGNGRCPTGELIFHVTDRETGESVHLTVAHYINSTWVSLPNRLHGIAVNGDYVLPINNKVVTGSKLRIAHDVTLPSGSDGIKIHGHFRPFV